MAEDFCLRHGLLPRERAAKLAKTKAAGPKGAATKAKKEKKPAAQSSNGKSAGGKGAGAQKKRKAAVLPPKSEGGAKPKAKPGVVPAKKPKLKIESDSDDDIPLAAL